MQSSPSLLLSSPESMNSLFTSAPRLCQFINEMVEVAVEPTAIFIAVEQARATKK